MIDERYGHHGQENSRHLTEGTEEIMYRPWNDFDVVEVWAHGPHPLKMVKLGYCFYGDIPGDDKLLTRTYSISTEITHNVPIGGVKLTLLSYEEAVKRAKAIDWSKVKIQR